MSRATRLGTTRLEIVAASALAIILSTVGQNSVLGVFFEQQSASLGISGLQFCTLLGVSTLLAAAGMRGLRGWVTGWPTSRLALVTAGLSAASLLLWGLLVGLESRLDGWTVLLLLALSFTGIRLFLRGIFKIIGSSVVNEQATAEGRSRTMALSNVLAGVVFAGMPLATYEILQRVGFVATMGAFAVASGVVAVLVYRVASGTTSERATDAQENGESRPPSRTLSEAKRTSRFWLYSMGLPLNTLIQSSASLMLIPIARHTGVEPARAYGIFLPAMLIGLPCVFFATRSMRSHGSIFALHQLALVTSTLGFLFLDTEIGFWAAGVGFGAAAGLYTAMASNLWPTLYGTGHAKAFYSFATSIDLVASAVGPILFGVIHTYWGVHVALMLVLPLPLLNVAVALASADGVGRRNGVEGGFSISVVTSSSSRKA